MNTCPHGLLFTADTCPDCYPKPEPRGVWLVATSTWGYAVHGIYDDELTARRAAEDYQKVAFCEFGQDAQDVLRAAHG